MKKYIPNPVDTEQIQLPKELEYLVEEMAKNVHEGLVENQNRTRLDVWQKSGMMY